MVLHLAPHSPTWLIAAAEFILVVHISAGSLGLLSGATALVAPKGKRLHWLAGNVFFVSMLTMSAIGAAVSPFLPQWSNVVPGILTFYLVATAWMTVRREGGQVGGFETAALVLAWSAAALGAGLGFYAASRPDGLLNGDSSTTFFIFASFPALAGVLDLRMIRGGGVAGPQRLARHIWRMCAALLIASISLFLGQPKVFPPALRGSPIMFLPEIAVLGLMIFWLVRVRAPRRDRPRRLAAPTASGMILGGNAPLQSG